MMKPREQEIYQLFFERAKDVVYLINAQGEFLLLSPAFETIVGWPREEWIGRHFRDLVHPDDLPKVAAAFERNMRGERVDQYEIRVRTREGGYRSAELTSTAVLEENNVVGVMGIARDVTDRQRAVEALRTSEENERLIVQSIHEIAYAVDITDDPFKGKVRFVSERVKEMLGYDAGEFVEDETLWGRIIHPDDLPAAVQAVQRFHEGNQPVVRVYRLRHKLTGEYRWFEDRSVAKFDAAGKVVGLLGTARDITEQITTEQTLREQQRMLSTLMSNLPGMVYRCKNDVDWTILFASEGSLELTGYKPEELMNNAVVSFASLIVESDRQRVWDEVQAALTQRQAYTLEYRIRHRSGRETWVWERGRGVFSENGELLALEGVISDITERKRAEEARRRADAKILQLGKMLDNANDAISAVDEHFRLIYWNAAAERLYGWKKEEVLEKEIAEVVRIDFTGTTREEVRAILRRGGTWRGEVIQYARDGRKIHIEMSVSPIYDDEGRVVGSFGVNRDITERKRIEQELARRNRQLSVLNTISTAVSRSLDVKGIMEILSQQLVEQMDFKTVFVMEYIEQEKVCRLLAIYPKHSLMFSTMEKLGLDINSVVLPFSGEENRVYAQLLEGKDWIGHNFAEITTPYIPAPLARLAQKLYAVQSIHNVPIISKDKLVGTIVVGSVRPAISEEERSIVLSVAQEVAPAIENARLFARVKQESTHRASLVEITNAINSTVEVEKLLDLIVEKALQLTHSTHGGLFLINEEDETLRIRASRGLSEETVRTLRFKKGEGIAGWVAQTGEGVLIHSVQSHPKFKSLLQIERLLDIISVPLNVEGKIVGVLGMDRFEGENPFTEEEFRIAQDFANQASLALAKCKLFDELQQKNRRLHKLHELSVKLTGETQTIFDSITTIIAELLNVPIATIAELQENSLTIRSMFFKGEMVHGGAYALHGTPCQRVRQEKTSCFYTNAFAQFTDDPFLREHGIETYLGIPVLDREGNVVGVLNVMDHRVRSFTEEDTNLLFTFSDRVYFELEEERRRKEREETQRALQVSEAEYRQLFEDVPAGVFRSTPDGKVLAANPALVKMLGYDSETELQGVDIGEDLFVNPEERKMWARKLEEHGVLQNVELTLKRKDGQHVTVLENTRVVRDEQGAVLYYEGTLIDITERKRAEETLKKLSSAVEQTADSVFITNRDGIIEYVNHAFEKLTGYAKEEALGKTPRILKSGKQDQHYYEELWKTILSGKVFRAEVINKKKNGELCYVEQTITPIIDAQGNITHFVSVCKDVTERRRSEEALRQQFEELQTVYQLTAAVSRAESLEKIYDESIDSVLRVLKADRVSILLFDSDAVMRFKAWRGLSQTYRKAVEGHSPWTQDVKDPRPILIEDVEQEPGLDHLRPVIVGEGVRALGFIPLVHHGRLIGKFMIYFNAPHPFAENEIRLAQTIASHVAFAIERKQAEEELEHRHQTLQALSTVGKVLTSSLDLNYVLSAIVQSVSDLFHTSAAAVLLYDANASRLSVAAQIGYDERLVSGLDIDVRYEGVTGLAVLRREPIYIPDVAKEPRYIKGAENVRSELAIPLLVAGHVVGVLDLKAAAVEAFDAKRINVLTQFADYAAVAIENARLYQQAQWRVKELFVLNEIMRLCSARLTFEELAVSTAEMLSQQFAYDAVSIYVLIGSGALQCVCRYVDGTNVGAGHHHVATGRGIIGWVADKGDALLVNDTSQDGRFIPCTDIDARSELAVPVKREGRVVAVINIDSRKKHAFTSSDLATAGTVAAQLSTVYDRIQLVERIRASQRQYEDLYENAPDMYQTLDEEGRILLCNETQASALGYRKDELIGKPVMQFMTPEYAPKGHQFIATVLTDGAIDNADCQFQRRDGSVIDVVVNARLDVGADGKKTILVTMRDVTEKKKGEMELLRLGSIVSNIADSVLITDRNGVIQYVNPAFEELTGYERAEVIGRTPRILKSGTHEKKFYEELWNTILSGRVFRGQFVNRKKNGKLYYEEKTITPLRDAEGKIVNFISTGQDITEKKLLEEQLLQAQKLDSVGTLASGIAHDFNNILNNILGFVTLLRKYADDPAKLRKYVDTVEKSAARGIELAQQLLSFVRKKKREVFPVNVASVLQEVVALCTQTFPKTVSISTEIAPSLFHVEGVSGELFQVFLNICLNARDAMPSGGLISITALNRKVGTEVMPGLLSVACEEAVEIRIADTGGGIPEEIREKIFDPFFTTKERGSGTGLGLSVAYSIVRNHHGSILVESQVQQGTTFIIYLPAVRSVAEVREAMLLSKGNVGHNELILLVDDEEAMRLLGEELLTEAGFRVCLAHDGVEAVELFRQRHKEISLVILDLVMPRMDGGKAYLELRKIREDLPVVFCTGYAHDSVITRLFEQENLPIIQKPFNPKQFVEIISARLRNSPARVST